jgi:hypothetical protein
VNIQKRDGWKHRQSEVMDPELSLAWHPVFALSLLSLAKAAQLSISSPFLSSADRSATTPIDISPCLPETGELAVSEDTMAWPLGE